MAMDENGDLNLDFGRYAPAYLVMHPAAFTLGRPVLFSTGTACSVGQCNISTAQLALDTLCELPSVLSRQHHNLVTLSTGAGGCIDERLSELKGSERSTDIANEQSDYRAIERSTDQMNDQSGA